MRCTCFSGFLRLFSSQSLRSRPRARSRRRRRRRSGCSARSASWTPASAARTSGSTSRTSSSTHVQAQIKENRRELGIAKQNLRAQPADDREAARHALHEGRDLAARGDPRRAQPRPRCSNRIDTEDQVSSLDAQVIERGARRTRSAVKHHARQLKRQNGAGQAPRRAARGRAAARSQSQLAQRQQLLSSLNGADPAADRRAAGARAPAGAGRARGLPRGAVAPVAGGRHEHVRRDRGDAGGRDRRAAVVATAARPASRSPYIGTPYVWAGAAPGGFDCSGLVMYAYSQDGRLAAALLVRAVERRRRRCRGISSRPATSSSSTGSATSGIYIGGGQFVHAPHTGDVVKVSSLDSGSYAYSYVGARRVI